MEKFDIFLIRKIIDLCFYYYKKLPTENKIELNESVSGAPSTGSVACHHLERRYISQEFEELPMVSSRAFW
jgi:hypothetical protein